MFLEQFFIPGLGCASYLVGDEKTNTAAVIDADRDVGKYLDAAHAQDLNIIYIIDTHMHADHVSGNTALAARTGAPIYLPENSGAKFPHTAFRDGETLTLGDVQINFSHTPGHTPESMTLLIVDSSRDSEPVLVLTGDTLFVGDVGRPDLVGDDAARNLAGIMHDTLQQKILPLPDSLIVYPGHGQGSLCGRALGTMRVSTIGYERQNNPALAPRSRDEFITFNTTELPEQPANHKRIKALNRQGPRVLDEITPRALTLEDMLYFVQHGAAVLDLRSRAQYINGHIPGAVHLPLDDQFSNRIGLLLPGDSQLVLQLDHPADYARVTHMLARVGFEYLVGYFDKLDDWQSRGYPILRGDTRSINAQELETLIANDPNIVVLDVREPWEFRSGHIPDAIPIPLGQLQSRYSELDPSMPTAVICHSGNRSQTGAALLAQKGFSRVYQVVDGTIGWKRRGYPIET
jgi:glyoxylase-like metal-dependent hydrolase (beta-lactamase superfamily II)/rhodanese-related sulfurtransferase